MSAAAAAGMPSNILTTRADVTVADETQAKEWITQHPGQARILKTTRPVPGGMNMVVRKDFCASECGRLGDWVNSPDGAIPGVGRLVIDSVQRHDYPVIQSVLLLSAGVYVLMLERRQLMTDGSLQRSHPRNAGLAFMCVASAE